MRKQKNSKMRLLKLKLLQDLREKNRSLLIIQLERVMNKKIVLAKMKVKMMPKMKELEEKLIKRK